MASITLYYEIRTRLAGTSQTWSISRHPPDTTTITLKGLIRGQEYEGDARAVGQGVASAWVPVTFTVNTAIAVPASQRVKDIDIVDGTMVIDCDYGSFRLELTQNVHTVLFANVSPSDTVIIQVIQRGAFTIAFGPGVTPVSGAPYVATPVAGAVDVVGLTTSNEGITWQLVAQQPIAQTGGGTPGAPVVTIAPSPADATSATDGATGTAPSIQVTATASGGTGTLTHSWTRADTNGGADYLIDNAASAAPTFTIPAGTTAYSATQQWRDTVTDAATLTTQAVVAIALTRTVTAAAALSSSFAGQECSALVFGTTGPTGGQADFRVHRNGTWEMWFARTVNGNTQQATLEASGTWHTSPTAAIGDEYSVQFAEISGLGPLNNGAPTFTTLNASRVVALTFTTSISGSADRTRVIGVSIRNNANPASEATGQITLSVTGENG